MTKQLLHKQANRAQRHGRVRSVISGTKTRPPLSVHVSITHVTAQLIDDTASQTLVYVSTIGQKTLKGNLTEKAEWVGQTIAAQAKTKKIKRVVFDRGSKLYHGRVAALAKAAREGG